VIASVGLRAFVIPPGASRRLRRWRARIVVDSVIPYAGKE
jgi:hypothetical protein